MRIFFEFERDCIDAILIIYFHKNDVSNQKKL